MIFGNRYKFHLTNGSVITLNGVKDLKVTFSKATGKLESYNVIHTSPRHNKLFHVSPLDIVAIEKL